MIVSNRGVNQVGVSLTALRFASKDLDLSGPGKPGALPKPPAADAKDRPLTPPPKADGIELGKADHIPSPTSNIYEIPEALGKNPLRGTEPPIASAEEAERLGISPESADLVRRAAFEQQYRYYQVYEGQYPKDLRFYYKNQLIIPNVLSPAQPQIPSEILNFPDHPYKEKLKDQYGRISVQEVIQALQALLKEKPMGKGFFKGTFQRFLDMEVFYAVSPEHWQQPIVQEQILKALEQLKRERHKASTPWSLSAEKAKKEDINSPIWIVLDKK